MAQTGSCLCGEITYEFDCDVLGTAVCHCPHCQRQSGGPFSVNLVIPKDQLKVTGPIKTYEDKGDHGSDEVFVWRNFCGNCGSPIYSELKEPAGIVALKSGTLDDTSAVQPQIQVWTETKHDWVALGDVPAKERE